MTTDESPRSFIYAAIPAAARATTARFMRDGPGPIGPRRPAVPNCKKPENAEFNSSVFSLSSQD